MLNNITKLKRYCKTTLNVLFNKNIDEDKFFYLYDRYFLLNQNFITQHIKIV